MATWLVGWGVAFWLIRRGVDYIGNPVAISSVFMACSALLVAVFRRRLESLASNPTALPFLVLLVVVATAIGLYALCPRYFRRPDGLIERHPEEFYLRMDPRYLVSKSFEVLFQQMVIVLLTLLLASAGLTMPAIVLTFLLLFGALHLPMLLIVGTRLGMAYALAAATAAVVFPLLILLFHYGFVYSYAVHWFAYVLAGTLAWWYEGRAPRARVGRAG